MERHKQLWYVVPYLLFNKLQNEGNILHTGAPPKHLTEYQNTSSSHLMLWIAMEIRMHTNYM